MFPLVFGSVFLAAGLIPIWLALRTFAKDRAISRWPRAPGTVTASYITSSSGSSRDQDGYERRYTTYDLVVEYTYTVDGRELEGKRRARDTLSSTTKPDAGRYPVGQAVSAYYDPNDPKTAYLEVHVSVGAIILFGLGSLFAGIGILVPVLVLFA